MVCDNDLKIYKETNSDRYAKQINTEFFELANKKYPDAFSSSLKHSIGDDHIPLNQNGIPTILLIDFDYPYWHTAEDTLDKCSDESLEKVGESIIEFIHNLN
jgi:Zn-dependent M28 family amino/carboxypeptidase